VRARIMAATWLARKPALNVVNAVSSSRSTAAGSGALAGGCRRWTGVARAAISGRTTAREGRTAGRHRILGLSVELRLDVREKAPEPDAAREVPGPDKERGNVEVRTRP
jgi:hypothetical protein